MPAAVVADEGVGEEDELAHDGSDGELDWLSSGDELVVLGLEVGVETAGL